MLAPSWSFVLSVPSFLHRQESTRPATSRAPSTFPTSRPSRRSGHARPLLVVRAVRSVIPTQAGIHVTCHRACALHVHDVASKPPVRSCSPPLGRSCCPFRHSCAGRNPRDLPSRVHPPRLRHRVQAASQRRRTSTAPSNICRSPGFLRPLPSFLRRQESTSPAISRAPSTFTTSCPSHVTTPSGINSALEHLSLAWIPAYAGMTEVRERASGATTGQRCSGR